MDPGDPTRVWRSPHNQPSAAQRRDTMQFTADLRRRHQGFVAFMAFVLAALLFTTGMILFHLIWPGPSDDAVDFTRRAIIPFFLLPWVAWIDSVVQDRVPSQPYPGLRRLHPGERAAAARREPPGAQVERAVAACSEVSCSSCR